LLIYHGLGKVVSRAICLAALSVLLTGCIGLIPSPFRPSPGPQKFCQPYDLAEAFDVVCRNYRLGPADELTLYFRIPPTSTTPGPYKLAPLDKIQVKFILDPQLNEDVIIRPDGMITLQAIGDIRAGGLTPEILAQRVEQKFVDAGIFSRDQARGDLKNYHLVTVHVLSFQEQGKELIQSLKTLLGGTKTSVAVNPDGTVDLPWVKERVLCAGYTVPEVERTADRLYKELAEGQATVSVGLSKAQSRKFYVLGEVGSPGAYEITQPITALHALAMAGGYNRNTADLTSVILISKNAQGKPFGRRLDLKRILDLGDMSSAILVKPYDVLFVPNTYIADVRLFMEQYVRTVSDVGSLVSILGGGTTQTATFQ